MAAVLPDAALIVRAPGDGLLVDEIKTWEVRGKPTNKIGRIAIAWAGSGCLVGTGARAALKCGSKAAPILMSASTWWQPQRKSLVRIYRCLGFLEHCIYFKPTQEHIMHASASQGTSCPGTAVPSPGPAGPSASRSTRASSRLAVLEASLANEAWGIDEDGQSSHFLAQTCHHKCVSVAFLCQYLRI